MHLSKTYLDELQQWRQEAEDNLRAAESWLSLLGLFWFEEGDNKSGSAEDNSLVFPVGTAPEYFANFILNNGQVSVIPNPDVGLMIDKSKVEEMVLQPDSSGNPSELRLGSLVMHVVERGQRFGLRVWDTNNPNRTSFPGRKWFSPSNEFRINATYTAYDPPKTLPIENILGDISDGTIVGQVSFELNGISCRLEALEGTQGRLFIIFKDETHHDDTYPGGRYLHTDAPTNGEIEIDFNRAYNPPCAFTNYATCSLPPAKNVLKVSITAGEKYFVFPN